MTKPQLIACALTTLLAFSGVGCGDDTPMLDGSLPDAGAGDVATPDAGANGLPLRAERLLSGQCPEGETCDSRTTGAHYSGSWDFEGLAVTAVGGIQYISLAVAGEDVPFTVTSSDPGRVSVVRETESQDQLFAVLLRMPLDTDFAQVHVGGVAEGSSLLELRSTDREELIDRIEVRVSVPTMPFVEDVSSRFHPEIGRSRRFCIGTEPPVIDRELRITSDAEVQQDTLLFRCFFVADDTSGPLSVTLTFAGVEYPLSIRQP